MSINIEIKNFLSIKQAQFSVEKGITVIAGKNGCGKSQLLLGIAQRCLPDSFELKNVLLNEAGFHDKYCPNLIESVSLNPLPALPLYRPAIKHIAEETRESEFAELKSLSHFVNADEKVGYLLGTQTKLSNLYGILANFYNAGTNENVDPEIRARWQMICDKFKAVFDKEILGEINFYNGTKIGTLLDDGSISSLNTFSTGELEFLSLLSDLVFEYEFSENEGIETPTLNLGKIRGSHQNIQKATMVLIDELDAHYHPDLQRKIINVIEPLCKEKYVIITTHSPSIMLSVNSDRLYYMNDSRNYTGTNQLVRVSDDVQLYSYLSNMYQGFIADIQLSRHISDATNNQILNYAKECLLPPTVVQGNVKREDDPQISTIRAAMNYTNPNVVIEVGAGRGRILTAFSGIDDRTLKKLEYFAIEPQSALHSEISEMAEKTGFAKRVKRFSISDCVNEKTCYDLCIMVNLIHEISPKELAEFFNNYIRLANRNAVITILEAEFANGEELYTMFYPEAVKKIFENYTLQCKFYSSVHHSYNGTVLYDMNLRILDNNFCITREDIIKGLREIVNTESGWIRLNKGNGCSAIQFAFKCHNLAYSALNLHEMTSMLQ